MNQRITVRRPTIEDAERISALLSELAERFIIGEFTPEGREQLLANLGVVEMRERLASACQRMGLARLLWDLARNESVRAGNVSGRFTVKASAYAVEAYERLGFRRSGPVADVEGVRSQPMDWSGTP